MKPYTNTKGETFTNPHEIVGRTDESTGEVILKKI